MVVPYRRSGRESDKKTQLNFQKDNVMTNENTKTYSVITLVSLRIIIIVHKNSRDRFNLKFMMKKRGNMHVSSIAQYTKMRDRWLMAIESLKRSPIKGLNTTTI